MDRVAVDVIPRLGAFQHIEREKAVDELQRYANSGEIPKHWPEIKTALLALQKGSSWQNQLGALLGAKVVVPFVDDGPFQTDMLAWCLTMLSATEVRVRICVAELLGALAKRHGDMVWLTCKDAVLESIQANFDRDEGLPGQQEDDRDCPGSPALGGGAYLPASESSLMGALLHEAYKPATPGSGNLRHGTEGWKCLETSVRCLAEVIRGCGPAFAGHADADLRQLLYRCFGHMNRFVRETGYVALAALCIALAQTPLLDEIAPEVAVKLVDGLSDNWSQVRYAASQAVRELMLHVGQARPAALSIILPAMCLNRYYVAEGVRLYSQQTWQLVVGDQGRALVATHIDTVVPYYISQSKANNHAVREAACACIAELMSKVEHAAVERHVEALLRALLSCFKDASWPVRDSACTACASAVASFPAAVAPHLPELYTLWLDHLWDNIGSVRENSAIALGSVAKVVGSDCVDRICEWLRSHMLMAKDQEEDSAQFADLENTTTFGVASKRSRDNDVAAHTDQAMFSCGSLAPKLQRGGGCMDLGFARPKQAWEASDGALYMLRELAGVDAERALAFLPQAADVAAMRHFVHSNNLRETLWNCLPQIAASLGKQAFKPHLELFLDAMFRDLSCEHQLCECAAGKCIGALRDFFGPSVFAARLQEHQARALESNPAIPRPAAPRSVSTGVQSGGLAAAMSKLPPGSAIPNLLGKR